MINKGGYQIVDLDGVSLAEERTKVPAGTYDKIKSAKHIPIIVTNWKWSGTEQRAVSGTTHENNNVIFMEPYYYNYGGSHYGIAFYPNDEAEIVRDA